MTSPIILMADEINDFFRAILAALHRHGK